MAGQRWLFDVGEGGQVGPETVEVGGSELDGDRGLAGGDLGHHEMEGQRKRALPPGFPKFVDDRRRDEGQRAGAHVVGGILESEDAAAGEVEEGLAEAVFVVFEDVLFGQVAVELEVEQADAPDAVVEFLQQQGAEDHEGCGGSVGVCQGIG